MDIDEAFFFLSGEEGQFLKPPGKKNCGPAQLLNYAATETGPCFLF